MADVRIVWNPRFEQDLMREPGMKQMLDQAGGIVERGAKRRAPVSKNGSHGRPPGHLRDSIESRLGEDEQGPYVDIEATATTPDGFPYGLIPELGSKPHQIRAKRAQALAFFWGKVNAQTFVPKNPRPNQHTGFEGSNFIIGKGYVDHPGTQPTPYLRPALDDLRGETL